MYFNKYDDFINENKETKLRKKAENIRKDIEKLQQKLKKASSGGNTQKEAKFKKKIEELTSEADALVGYANQISGKTEDPKKESESKDSNNIEADSDNTNKKEEEKKEEKSEEKPEEKKEDADIKKMSKDKLNDRLQKWNDDFAQEFKFENDMPKTPAKNFQELINSISGNRKTAVKEGISQLLNIFSSPHFKGETIEISGYTSTTGSSSYNASLSDRRAESVLNSIEALMKEKKIENDIIFTTEGHGEDPNYLIILNDTTTKEVPKVNTKIAKISDDIISKITNDKEARQELNRRVLINLKGFKAKDIIGKDTPIETKEVEKTVEKPESPDPQNLKFNYDSYILTKESEQLLKGFANDIKKWNSTKEDGEKIKTLYISAHTKKPKEDDKKQEKVQDELLAFLSTNRAYTVKRFLQIEIGENISKDISFFLYPVASNMGEEKKVEIHFDNSKHMQEAKKAFSEMASKYDIKEGNRGYSGKNYTTNEALRKNILYNLGGYSKIGKAGKTIPLELWYPEGRFGLGYEEDFEKFKDKIEKIFKKSKFDMKAEDYVYKSI